MCRAIEMRFLSGKGAGGVGAIGLNREEEAPIFRRVRGLVVVSIVLAGWLLSQAMTAHASATSCTIIPASYDCTLIDFPGGNTLAIRINDAGQIVGQAGTRGFLRHPAVNVTLLNVPRAR